MSQQEKTKHKQGKKKPNVTFVFIVLGFVMLCRQKTV